MTHLVVTAAGPATSVQDFGRLGAQRYGLPPSGAMDRLSLAAANALLGNKPDKAAIEIGPLPAAFSAQGGNIRIALSGAVRSVQVNERTVAINQTVILNDGDTLKIGAARGGVFSYLALEDGIAGEPIFGSLSVNARAEIGAPYSRTLKAGDKFAAKAAKTLEQEKQIGLPPSSPDPIRVVMGPQDNEFGDARDILCASEWRVSAISDRMGYRMEGPAIKHERGHNIVSDGTVNGSIQVPGNGQPIVLMPDRGTTGGYPKIATVISADLGRLAQMPAGSSLRFVSIAMAEAQSEARKMFALIHSLADRISDGAISFNLAALSTANVAGVAVSAVDAQSWQSAPVGEP